MRLYDGQFFVINTKSNTTTPLLKQFKGGFFVGGKDITQERG